jgi:hypothetical protein
MNRSTDRQRNFTGNTTLTSRKQTLWNGIKEELTMKPENYLQRNYNEQGYRILDGNTVHYCDNPEVVFEWALIDRGEGKSFAVGHWVQFEDCGWDRLEKIEWAHGHYFDTLEEAEVYYREQVVREMHEEIYELRLRLQEEVKELEEARKLDPKEEY